MWVWSETGREQDERAVSGTICADPALTTRKKRESVSGGRGSAFERYRLVERISTVSTWHAYKGEGLRQY
jgi:hypothetical protein